MSGRVGDLSEKQAVALDEFKRVCAPLLQTKPDFHDDHFCLRWLRARNFNVDASKNMLEKSMDYRRRYRLDTILTEFRPNSAIRKMFPGGTAGFDRKGQCIMIYPLVNIYPKYFLQMTRRSEVVKMLLFRMEESIPVMRQQSRKLGHHIEAHTIIFDVEGFDILHNISAAAISVFIELVGTYESNYPENLAHAIIVNAPPIFNLFFNMIKPLLNATTLAKVQIFGKDDSVWKAALLELADADQLPVEFGGTRTGPGGDPLCSHEIVHAPKLNSEVVKKLLAMIPEEEQMKQITVPRRGTVNVPVSIKEGGSGIKIQFESDGHDVAFALIRCAASGDDKEELLPLKRYSSHEGPVVICMRCTLAGDYVLRFDNSYSALRSKALSYNLDIIPAAKLNDAMLMVHEP